MQFYFVRHGQSANNWLWDQTGSNKGRAVDAGLTEAGRQQAALVAQGLSRQEPSFLANGHDPHNRAGFGLTHLYCSLMSRAVATGHAMAEALDLPLVAWPDAHEEGGVYEENEETGQRIGQPGLGRSYLLAHYPRLVLPDGVTDAGWYNRPFEERDQRPARAQRFLRELLERHGKTEERVAVVSHGGFYNHLLAVVLGLEARGQWWFLLNNTAITRIDFTPDETRLVYQNRVEHLPRELIT